MNTFEAGEHLKKLITFIRDLKIRTGHKPKDIIPCIIEIRNQDNLSFYYQTKDIIERSCKITIEFV